MVISSYDLFMSPENARQHLEELCRRLDELRVLPAAAMIVASVPLGCSRSPNHAVAPAPAAEETRCDDGEDDDGDGAIDCDDSDCLSYPMCGGELYAAP